MRQPTSVASTMLVLAACLGTTAPAAAQADYLSENRAAARSYYGRKSQNGVIVNGRCRGMSYGTGARSCGTATGGPVGGISGRN